MIKHVVLYLFLLSCTCMAQAQDFTIRGTVFEEETGMGLMGAAVVIQGTTNGAQTDISGGFSLKGVKVGDKLAVSFIGMKTEIIPITNKERSTEIKVYLKNDNYQLDQVVVTGYGTARKRDLTGAIVSISGEDIKNAPTNNVMSSLQGKVPGLMVTNSGSAGAEPDIKIRGIGTLNASSNPLYVVDGMLMSDIKFLSNSDIASMEILKDPSSLAIFGVQGANGVIIITTKRAEGEKTSVSYDGYFGAQTVWKRDRVSLTNASEFTMLYNEMLQNQDPNAASWVPEMLGTGTDWQSKVLRERAVVTNHNLTVSKSGKNSKSLLSVGYYKQDGVLKYNTYQRFNIRFSQDYDITKNLKAGGNINLSRMDSKPASAKIQNAVMALPTYVPYAPEEDYDPENPGSVFHPSADIQSNVGNPVAQMELYKNTEKYRDYRIIGNIYGEWNFLKDFTFKATGYMDLGLYRGEQYTPRYDVNNSTSHSAHKNDITAFYRKSDEGRTFQADFLLGYKKMISDHRIDATVGYTARKATSEGFNAKVDSLANGMKVVPEDLWMLSMGSVKRVSAGDWWNEEAFISYLARVNYAFKDRYLLTATFRADGSSKFSPSHRWGYFPSVGLGWVISEETFMKPLKEVVDFAKLRVSWGKLGNDKIGNYLYYPTINPKGKQVIINGVTQFIPTLNYDIDKDIHWEVMTGIDVGLSAQLFNNRLGVELGYYSKTTNDLLANVSVSSSIGAGYAITNAGSINNKGFEFTLSWQDKIGDFTYGIGVNGGTLKNKVTELGDNNADIISGDYHRTSVGHPISSYYGYVQDGIFQTQEEIDNYYPMTWNAKPGDIRYKDLNGDGKITDADRTFLGNYMPTFTYGFNFTFGYKNFDLNIDFNGVSGNKILDLKKTVAWTTTNFYEKSLQRWHGEGTSNKEPILDKSRGHNYLPSTNLLENGSYLRLRNIQLGYTLPQTAVSKLGISGLRVYASGQNLLTFKHNSGYTPEIPAPTDNDKRLLIGMDQGDTYPLPSIYTVGLSINF
ncbi:SusC/RagA family TonB-linked outer membrane protein [Bacteroides finegoldii]|uniref:SusC/RagA family TonB-linked outer membrane protein n=1 Tax=Bacteroides finegoldii TaxID=338188 RepID=UPI0018A0464E|nr:TonB-dependent receptor [Bacteroides finegoldii]